MKTLLIILALPAVMIAHTKKRGPDPYTNCPIHVYNFWPYAPGEGGTTVFQFSAGSKAVKAFEGDLFTKDAFGTYHHAGHVEWENSNGKPLKPHKSSSWKVFNYIWYGKPGHMGFKLTKLLFSDGTQWKPDPACEWTGPVFQELRRR